MAANTRTPINQAMDDGLLARRELNAFMQISRRLALYRLARYLVWVLVIPCFYGQTRDMPRQVNGRNRASEDVLLPRKARHIALPTLLPLCWGSAPAFWSFV